MAKPEDRPIITLLTDFGTQDWYVAAVKGVILQIAPEAVVVDVTHDIEPQDIVQAAFVLRRTLEWFPPGTIHLAVVDPGVGSSRRILAGRYAGQYVVAPDNGLITMVHHELPVEAVHQVANRAFALRSVSATFHGRDIMAPAAAHLAAGVTVRQLGPPTDHVEVLKLAAPRREAGPRLIGEVLCIDRFGNLITNITRHELMRTFRKTRAVEVYLREVSVGPVRTGYHEVATGQPVALIGGSDHLEISINCGHAEQTLSGQRGTTVEIR
ncbi:MAG: SAM-dependent chlorinase/fluorinase [bacterium]|nr:SAM-dependent chlorinase/fluorinase [bacterium]